jgi:ADP-ribose pyrophosphatase YjhB (NUDIX family)
MKGNRIDIGVKALIFNEGKFLVMHNNGVEEDLWELPGGRMEFGETAEETLRREMIEETGLVVEPIRLLDTWNLIREDYQIAGIIYLCKFEKGEVRLSDEHDAFKWISTDEESLQMVYEDFRVRMLNWNWDEIRGGNHVYRIR